MTANSAVLILFFLDLSRVLRVQVFILRLTPSESQVTIEFKVFYEIAFEIIYNCDFTRYIFSRFSVLDRFERRSIRKFMIRS